MTIFTNTAESGQPNGTDVSTANSAQLNAFTSVTPGAGGTIRYSTTQIMKGALSIAVTPASAIACYAEWAGVAGATTRSAVRFYVFFTGLPSSGNAIYNLRSSGGGTSLLSLSLNSTGNLQVISDVDASTAILTTGTVSLNTWYRIEVTLDAPSTTTAAVNLNTYLGDGTTAVANLSGTATGRNFGTSVQGTARFGRITAVGTMPVLYFDDMAFQTGDNAALGPSVANVAPTANAGADILNGSVGTPISRTGTAADTDGTIALYEWTCTKYPYGSTAPTLTGAATATVGFTPSATGIYQLSFRAQDNLGAWSTPDTMLVYVPGNTLRVFDITSNPGSWSLTGPDIVTALADADTATYTQSNVAAANPSTQRLRLDPLNVPSTFSLNLTWRLSIAASGTATVRLYEGSVVRKTWVVTTPGTTSTTVTLTLTTAEIASITSWLNLDLEIEWLQ